jgi:hypothetical protein
MPDSPYRIELLAWFMTIFGNDIDNPFSDEQLIRNFEHNKEVVQVLVTQATTPIIVPAIVPLVTSPE